MKQLRAVGTVFSAVALGLALTLLSGGAALSPAVAAAGGILLCLASVLYLLYLHVFSRRSFDAALEALSRGGDPERCPAELRAVRDLLKARQARLEHGMRDMKTLNSYISHEMKNSLNILSAKVELGEGPEALQEYLKRMALSIDDILILSEVKSGPAAEATDLAMVCALAVDDYRRAGPDITFDLPPEGVDEVPGREHLYYRAVANLLDNAVKYGGGSPIRLTIRQREGCVVLCVQNGGPALAKDHFSNLFDTNYRYSSLKKNSYGIGLSLVKNVAELGGGSVWAENGPEGDVRFYLVIPAGEGYASDATAHIVNGSSSKGDE